VVDKLIDEYCREPGVRSLERMTKKLTDKLALKIVNKHPEHIVVNTSSLKDYLGLPIFSQELMYE
jgi:ATP-dependent Lon protease